MHGQTRSTITMLNRDPFVDLEIPPELEVNLKRHREHLVQLIATLRSAGIKEDQIETSVSVIVDSYKAELIRTMKEMMR